MKRLFYLFFSLIFILGIVVSVDITAYATNTWSVAYDGNGNSEGSAPAETICTIGEAAIVSGNVGNLERPGFRFGGWSTEADGTGINIYPGNAISSEDNTVLYARWTPIKLVQQKNSLLLSQLLLSKRLKSWRI